MSWKDEDNHIVIGGWDKGIAPSPYLGHADMRNVDTTSISGEVSVAFKSGAVTIPPIFNAVAFTAQATGDTITVASVTGLYVGCAIVLNTNTATGLTTAIVYYVQAIVGLTFKVSLFPNSPVINITVDGSGTLTTYQYGNQRALVDNGAPVSYHHAPELEGVFLVDSSNYVWFWQQGTSGASPINTVLFLGNISGIGATSNNQTGLVYWNGQVVLVQQPNTFNLLDWSLFLTANGTDWDYTSIRGSEPLPLLMTTTVAIPYKYHWTEWRGSDQYVLPEIIHQNRLFTAATATTITSATFSVKTGDIIYAVVATWNNIVVNSITFNGNATTTVTSNNGTSGFPFGIRIETYTAPSDMTGEIVGTFASTSTNRLVSYYVIKNATEGSGGSGSGVSSSTIGDIQTKTAPNRIGTLFWWTNNDNVIITNPYSLTKLAGVETSGVGQDWMYAAPLGNHASITLKKSVPITIGEDDTIYYGAGQNIVGSLLTNAGGAFNSKDATTYTFNWNALDLPADEVVQSLSMASSTLFVGATSNKVYPWDTISPSFDYPIILPESGVVDFVASNNLLYTFTGSLGKTYLTNNSSASLYQELPAQLATSVKPYYFYWDANMDGAELFFTFQTFTNGSPTPQGVSAGVWAFNSSTNALRMVQSPIQGYDSWVRMVCPVSEGNSLTMIQPQGQGLLVGYSRSGSYFLDYSINTPYDNWESYIETDIIPVATYFDKHTFEKIEYKLGAPMVSGEGIRVYQRSNLSEAYALIAEFTTPGQISDESSINWENVQWVQFRIELRSTPTTPSYVRLRELRLK